MLFLGIAVVCIILAFVFLHYGRCNHNTFLLIISGVLAFTSLCAWLASVSCVARYQNDYEKIKTNMQDIHSQYSASDKTQDDWEWVTEQCELHNQKIVNIEENAKLYAIVDTTYFLTKKSPDDYVITISEDKIEFPMEYNLVSLNKTGDEIDER